MRPGGVVGRALRRSVTRGQLDEPSHDLTLRVDEDGVGEGLGPQGSIAVVKVVIQSF